MATAAGGAYLAFAQDRGPQSLPPEPNRASDTIKPSKGGGPEIPSVGIIPNIPKEPTATVEAQKSPTPTVEPTSTATSTPELTATPKPEILPFDWRIYSMEQTRWTTISRYEVCTKKRRGDQN